MKIITVATHSQAYFPVLKESARKNNINLVVLGWGEKWAGFGWKLKLLKDYLYTLSHDEIILVLDAFDTIIISNTNEIIKKFKGINKPIICAAERKHYSRIWNWAYEKIFNKDGHYPQTPTGYSYLNAGAWMSSTGYALSMLDKASLENTTNDQTLFTHLYTKGHIFIDYGCEIFTCIRKESDLLHINRRFKNVFTQTYPCIIHAPADVSMKNSVKCMGYQPVRYTVLQRAWKYIYSVYAFWGTNSIKQNS